MPATPTSNPTAFDAFAGDYDNDFTDSSLGKLLRPRVWEKLGQHFKSGQHVLELTCGTGEDAIWLARRGVQVTATDGSAEMISVARAKAEAAAVTAQVSLRQMSLQQAAQGYLTGGGKTGNRLFDGVYSNFGGLNTIKTWRSLAEALATIVKPGGKVILVPMGPFCPWEMIWYSGHGQFRTALRRLGQNAHAKIGEMVIPIWYPAARQLKADFSAWFQHLGAESLGLWLPPTYLDHWVKRWPEFFARLNRFEKATAHYTGGWGDHYIIIFERK